jgi:hypothetical protein
VRDAIDLKRMMITVVIALLPCVLFAMYNTGYQANLAIAHGASRAGQLADLAVHALGFGFDPTSILACMLHGAIYFLPVYAVTMLIGGHIEVLFAIVRKHEINEGFLVTGLLFPLTLPADDPAVAGRPRHHLRRHHRQGGLRRHRHERAQPRPGRPRLPVLRLPGPDLGRRPLDRRRPQPKADGLSGATALAQAAADTPNMMAHWSTGGRLHRPRSPARWARPRTSPA